MVPAVARVMWTILFAMLTAVGRAASAAEYYVSTNGSGGEGTSWEAAFTNVQDALTAAGDGDVVYLAGQVFTVTNELVWSSPGVSVYGGYEGVGEPGTRDPALWPTVIRQPAGFTPNVRLFRMQAVTNGVLRDVTLHGGRRYKDSGACLFINGGTNITLSGVTIQNGYGYSDNGGTLYGAGLYAAGVGNLALFDCTIRSNTFSVNAAAVVGAGLYAANSTLTVSNALIWANGISPAGYLGPVAGGVYLTGGTSVFRDCVVKGNYTGGNGGTTYGAGLTVASGTHLFRNCLVTLNSVTAGSGDGVYVAGGTARLDSCTVAHNFGQGIQRAGGTVIVSNSIVWANGDDVTGAVALAYCDIEDGDSNGVAGCISADPRFERGYYLAEGSPCADTGSVAAADVGLDTRTTRADGTADADILDLGYHYAAGVDPAKTDLYVSPDGADGNAGTNWTLALRTLTRALALAEDGTRVHVATGVYSTAGGEAFPLTATHLAGLQVIGTNAAATLLDAGAGAQRVMTLAYLGGDSRLEGLTLTRGRGATSGGALSLSYSALTLAGCDITASRAYVDGTAVGGGAYFAHAFVTVTNCSFRGNWAQGAGWATGVNGGGIYATGDGGLSVFDSVIAANYLSGNTKSGAGLYAGSSGEPTVLRNVLIARNTAATYGGGLTVAAGRTLIDQATIADNPPEGVRLAAGTATIGNSILWGNGDDVRDVPAANLSSCNVEDGDNAGANGCISVDPGFVDTNHYHLASRAGYYTNGFFTGGAWGQSYVDSALIDAGAPASPFSREPQPSGRRANLGAYGNSPVASKTFLEEPGVFGALTVHAYPASHVGADYATLSGEILHAGGAEDPSVFICWGSADGGTARPEDWQHVEAIGTRGEWELFSRTLEGIAGLIQYRCYATNSSGEDWSLLQTFRTASPPSVENTGAVSVRRRTASLTGLITDIGGATPACWFYCWPAGGGTSVVAAGDQAGGFTNEVVGLAADTLYTYRILASNSAGTAWSADASFQTLEAAVGWYVATNGDATSGTNWPTAYRDIAAALAVAEPGDTLYVAGHTFERQTAIAWSNSSVSLLGSYEGVGLPGASSAAQWPTIVRPQATYSPRLLQLQAVSNVTLSGLVLHGGTRDSTYGANLMMSACTNVTLRDVTLRGGTITAGNGGSTWGAGAYIGGSTNILLESCTVTNNSMSVNASDAKGTALYLVNSSIAFSNCLVRDNRIIPGGWLIPQGNGIYITGGSVRFIRSVIARNSSTAGSTADADGGGLYVASGAHSLLNCLVLSNACVYNGDGIYVAGGAVALESCTVADNAGEGVARGGGTLTVRNSILWDNGVDVSGAAGLSYCDIEDGTSNGVEGCFSADPLFVDRAFYHESSRGGHYAGGYFSGGTWQEGKLDSPCIDAGDQAGDWDTEPVPNGRRLNVGAYGNTETASKTKLYNGAILMVR